MQQDRNNSRRPSSSIQQNSARRQGKSRKAYDWTQDRRPSNQNRRRTQGYQEQTLDFSGGNVTFENHSSGYADNSIQFPQQTARRPNNQNQSRRQGQQRSQRPRQNTTAYPTNGSRPRNGQRPQNVQSARRPQSGGRYRPTEANLRSPARREGRKKRRLTRAAVRRRRAIRRLTALALLLCVIGVGVYLTVTMLFKINTLEVAVDGEVVQEVGGYSSAEILQARGVHAEENIFSFDPAEKAAALEKQFPLLENIRVERDYPGTVVVRVTEAQPAWAMQTSSGWLTLSGGLKILEKDSAQPAGLPTLYGGEPVSAEPGEQLTFAAEPKADSTPDSAADSSASGTVEEEADQRLESLNTLLAALDAAGMSADVTRIEFADVDEMAFLYQDRISVWLGTLNELEYKLKLAKHVLLNEDGKGCAATDTGKLDFTHISMSSTRKFTFAQGEPELPSGYIVPEPVEETPAEEGVTGETADGTADAPTQIILGKGFEVAADAEHFAFSIDGKHIAIDGGNNPISGDNYNISRTASDKSLFELTNGASLKLTHLDIYGNADAHLAEVACIFVRASCKLTLGNGFELYSGNGNESGRQVHRRCGPDPRVL